MNYIVESAVDESNTLVKIKKRNMTSMMEL
jgi:hypothetical protein